jgi:hypothetical protein
MLKNNYNLHNKEDRKEIFNEYLINRLPDLDFTEFDENISFLCDIGLSDEWLKVVAITIGELICPNNLTTETSLVRSVGIRDLLTLARELKVFDDKTISHYVKKLNTKSFARISVLSEIKIASTYLRRGYMMEIEPPNGKIGKSRLEGKSDQRVNLNDEWIYFEITRENFYSPDNSILTIGEITSYIEEEIKRHDLLPWRMKIYAIIIDKNKVLSYGWRDHLLQHLQKSSLKLNFWKEFEGIKYMLTYHIPGELFFWLSIPITDTKKYFMRRLKQESDQIPRSMKGVIAMELDSNLNINSFNIFAQEVLTRHSLSNIIAIIIWYEKDYRIIHKRSINAELLQFLVMPFN